MGKYSHITGRLDPVPIRDPKQQERVDFIKEKILTAGPSMIHDVIDGASLTQEANNQLIEAIRFMSRDGRRELEPEKLGVDDFAEGYARVRVAVDTIRERMKTFEYLLEAYKQIVIENFEHQGLSSMGFADGGKIRIDEEPYTVVEDQEKLRVWLRENNLERLLSIQWNALNAHVKECLLNEEPEPDGVAAYVNKKLVFTRAKS